MSHLKVLLHAMVLTAFDRAGDLLSLFMLPKAESMVKGRIPAPRSPWITAPLWTRKTVDGGVLEGVGKNTGAKYAIPKGLPGDGQRLLAIEGPVHEVDGFNGEILEGYGKGIKTLLADETVVVKVNGKSCLARMNYHVHDADRAGLHYDLVVAGVPAGQDFEINIPRGPFKGRFAFVHTPKGVVVTPMKDRGVVLPKPDYSLKPVEWLETIDANQYVIERKYDGSLDNVAIDDSARAAHHSHRDGGDTYYDKLPALEFIKNTSPLYTLRRLDPQPKLGGTILKGELVHPDGVSRTSGILNSHPEKARFVQERRGPVEFYAWDIVQLKGKDISHLSSIERRRLLEKTIGQIRLYNRHYHVAERYCGSDPASFYRRVTSDKRGLPFSEGIVLKPINDAGSGRWFKVKNRDFADLIVESITDSGPGTKYHGSLAVMLVKDPVTGGRGEVGSFAISDAERQWIYDHREQLLGATAKVSVMEVTEAGAPRAGVFHGWHPDPRYGGIGSEQALMMYAETAAGLDPAEAQRTLYAMKSAAGWRRAA